MVVGTSGRTRLSGFTLLEVMVALVLTGLVVVVAYAAAQAGMDARTRLTARLQAVRSARGAREILRDALRNARAPEAPGDPRGGFVLSNNTLSFVAAGGASPLDPDYDWRFTIGPDHGQVRVQAVAIGHAAPAQLSFGIPGVTQWRVWMLAPDGRTWQSEWADSSAMPRAIVVAFWNQGRLVDWPLHLALWPGARPAAADSLNAPITGDAGVAPPGRGSP